MRVSVHVWDTNKLIMDNKMEMFSLQDDYRDVFIIQSDKIVNDGLVSNEENCEKDGDLSVLADPMDFSSLCTSLLGSTHYSDISDDDFEIPSSQMTTITKDDNGRLVHIVTYNLCW